MRMVLEFVGLGLGVALFHLGRERSDRRLVFVGVLVSVAAVAAIFLRELAEPAG